MGDKDGWYPWKEVPTWRVQATLTRSGYLSGAMRMSRCDRSMANVRMTEKLLNRRWTKSAARVLLRSHVSRWDVVVYVRGGGVYLPNNNINIGDNINIWIFRSYEAICQSQIFRGMHTRLANLNVPAVQRVDDRTIEVIATGLPLWHGSELAIDTTLVSLLTGAA